VGKVLRLELTNVALFEDDLQIGVKGYSSLEIAGFLRKLFK